MGFRVYIIEVQSDATEELTAELFQSKAVGRSVAALSLDAAGQLALRKLPSL